MKIKSILFCFTFFSIFLTSGCGFQKDLSFRDINYGLTGSYPQEFTIIPSSETQSWLQINNQQGSRIEIFPSNGLERPFGFSEENVTQDELDNYIPKKEETKIIDGRNFTVRYFYKTGREKEMITLKNIVDSVKKL